MSKAITVEIKFPEDFKEEVLDLIVKAATAVIGLIPTQAKPEVSVTENEVEEEEQGTEQESETDEEELYEEDKVEETETEVTEETHPLTVKEQVARKKLI